MQYLYFLIICWIKSNQIKSNQIKSNRAWVTESEEGRVYPNRKHLGLIQSNEKYNSVFILIFIGQWSMIANATWFESIQTCTTCKNWKHCHGLACTTDSAMWSESHRPICLRWVVCLALDNNVFHFNPNNNTLTKKHEIISGLLFHSLLVVYFLNFPEQVKALCQHKMKHINLFFAPPCRGHHVSAIVGGMCKLNGYRLSPPPKKKINK